MKHTLLIIFLTIGINSFAQRPKDSLTNYISKLSWNSFTVISSSISLKIIFDENSEKIISYPTVNKRLKILKAIDSNNAVAIHLILTKLLEPSRFNICDLLIYHKNLDGSDNSGKIDGVAYFLNGINWKEYYVGNEESYCISSDEISKIIKYWKRNGKVKNQSKHHNKRNLNNFISKKELVCPPSTVNF